MDRFEVKYRKKPEVLKKHDGTEHPLGLKREDWVRVYCTTRRMAELFAKKISIDPRYEVVITEF